MNEQEVFPLWCRTRAALAVIPCEAHKWAYFSSPGGGGGAEWSRGNMTIPGAAGAVGTVDSSDVSGLGKWGAACACGGTEQSEGSLE